MADAYEPSDCEREIAAALRAWAVRLSERQQREPFGFDDIGASYLRKAAENIESGLHRR